MNLRTVTALLSLLASTSAFADNVYEYWGLMKPSDGAENPWGLAPEGTLFWLRVLVDPAAVDQNSGDGDTAVFDSTGAILFIGDRKATVTGLDNAPVHFQDNATFDDFSFSGNVELDGVTQFALFDVRIPTTTFDLDPVPGGVDLPPLFETAFPVQFGAADSGFVVTFPDHEHGVFGRVDTDADGWDDSHDNCLLQPNDVHSPFDFGQPDTDQDDYGNACDADFNNDCQTNFVDLGTMKEDFFQTGDLQTDLNADGFTNFVDLGIMKALFFLPPGPSALTNVCDPHASRRPSR